VSNGHSNLKDLTIRRFYYYLKCASHGFCVNCQPGLQAEEVFPAELGSHQVKPGQVNVRFVTDRNRPVAVLQKKMKY
jgi:hypothetical protein